MMIVDIISPESKNIVGRWGSTLHVTVWHDSQQISRQFSCEHHVWRARHNNLFALPSSEITLYCMRHVWLTCVVGWFRYLWFVLGMAFFMVTWYSIIVLAQVCMCVDRRQHVCCRVRFSKVLKYMFMYVPVYARVWIGGNICVFWVQLTNSKERAILIHYV